MEEEKEKVVLDYLENDKVAVYDYDEISNTIVEHPREVCLRISAMEQYKVVGEMAFGEVELYNKEKKEEEDFSEFSDIDEKDP